MIIDCIMHSIDFRIFCNHLQGWTYWGTFQQGRHPCLRAESLAGFLCGGIQRWKRCRSWYANCQFIIHNAQCTIRLVVLKPLAGLDILG